MTDACPHCGSVLLTIYQDRSGRCNSCGNSFMSPELKEKMDAIPVKAPPQARETPRLFDSNVPPEGTYLYYSGGQGAVTQVSSFDQQLPPSWDNYLQAQKTRNFGGNMVMVSSIFFLLSIFTSIIMLAGMLSVELGQPVSVGDIFWLAGEVPLFALILYSGIFMQIIFFILALSLGSSIKNGSEMATNGGIVFGIIAIILSFLIMGGIVAVVGGILTIIGAGLAYSAAQKSKLQYLATR